MITAWCIADGLLRTHRTLFSRSQSRRKNTFSTTASWKWPVDVKSLTSSERERLRLYSKSIPLVVDKEPLDVIYEDEYYLCVNKPDFVKMHPAHRSVISFRPLIEAFMLTSLSEHIVSKEDHFSIEQLDIVGLYHIYCIDSIW